MAYSTRAPARTLPLIAPRVAMTTMADRKSVGYGKGGVVVGGSIAEYGLRVIGVTGFQTCALPISGEDEGGRYQALRDQRDRRRAEARVDVARGAPEQSRLSHGVQHAGTGKDVAVDRAQGGDDHHGRSEERRVWEGWGSCWW